MVAARKKESREAPISYNSCCCCRRCSNLAAVQYAARTKRSLKLMLAHGEVKSKTERERKREKERERERKGEIERE
jgi:hypothetical protein